MSEAAAKLDVGLLEPPDDAAVEQALQDFARVVKGTYGSRLKGVYLFGSRARGDHGPDSDADVAVVLEDSRWQAWQERMRLADLEYRIFLATGADVQGWPVQESRWLSPRTYPNHLLIEAMQRDGRALG